jgi:hypothetical protein
MYKFFRRAAAIWLMLAVGCFVVGPMAAASNMETLSAICLAIVVPPLVVITVAALGAICLGIKEKLW